MEENNLIVSLGTLTSGEENLKLEKLVENGKTKNFRKILDYMLDPKEDSLNPAYNIEEKELRDSIYGWKKNADSGQGGINLRYLKQDNSLSETLDPEGTVCSYTYIIKDNQRTTQFGERVEFKGIDLIASFEPVGGY